ncbi:MAG: hypothetical protein KDB26_05940 [Microthrixaceae bacterium]|nr:hypothetical protein [Microthrixaceae bacterium]
MSGATQRTRGHFRQRSIAVLSAIAALTLVAASCSEEPPPTPPATGVDLTIAVSGGRAEIDSTATYTATVSSVGTQGSTEEVSATIVSPPGQTITEADGIGWTCVVGSENDEVTCTNPSAVPSGMSMAPISVTTAVSGSPYAASVFGIVHVADDVNLANDSARGTSTVVPAFGPDQLYIQLAGALNLRSGGNVSSGDVAITSDVLGPSSLVINATVGSTQVEANLSRLGATLFTGPVKITDPALQGGTPLEVTWRGDLRGFGAQPFRNLTGNQIGLRIPTLDLPGISGAALSGIEFTLGITAGDFQPDMPNPAGQPPLTFADPGLNWAPTFNVPDRVVNGANFDLGVNLIASSGAANGPVSATINLPAGIEFVSAGSGTTCTALPAVQNQFRCFLNASLNTPVASNITGRILGAFLPTGFPTITVRLRPTVDFSPQTISVGVDAPNSGVATLSTILDPRPPGPDVGITMNGPELTSGLWFTEGTGISSNRYQVAVDNVGTATSANSGLTATVNLPAGVTYTGFTTSGLTNANRFSCSAEDQVVTCTRPNGIPVTGLLTPAPSFEVLVDIDSAALPSVVATATVVNTNDVDPTSPAKSATTTTMVAAAGAPQFAVSLSNGSFDVQNRTVLNGGFTYNVAANGRLDGINGCASSRDFTPAILLVPVVGPTLVPEQYSDNTLCINVSRVPLTNTWAGTVRVDFVAGPVFIPGAPIDFPVMQPRPVSAPAATISAPVLNGDGSVSGSASGANPELALNGGATYQINWNLGEIPGVTCVDNDMCP